MSVLSLRSRLTGIDNDAKDLIYQGIRNGQSITMADAFAVDQYVRNIKRNDAWKYISFFRDFLTVPNLNPNGGPRISFTRASGATRVNQVGLVETVGVNVPRFDYDPVTKAAKGLLIEESRTNLFLRSEEFDSAAWNKPGSTITANAIVAPDGILTGDKIVATNTLGGHQLNYTISQSGSQTLSVYAKKGEYSHLYLAFFTGSSFTTWFNLDSGTVGTVESSTTTSITALPDGWYKCSITRNQSTTVAVIGVSNADNVNSYTGDGVSGIYLWGAQLEVGAFPTSYIPTTSATVTRAADIATIGGNDFKAFYNSSEGSFLFEGTQSQPVAGNFPRLLYITPAEEQQVEGYLSTTPNLSWRVRNSSAANTQINLGGYVADSQIKLITTYGQSRISACVNGSSVSETAIAGTLNSGNTLNLTLSVTKWYIKKIGFFSKQLSNSTIQPLTS